MTSLFDGDTSAALRSAALLEKIKTAYSEKLLLNPPTPSFNPDSNPKAERFARFATEKDITRFLAVLDALGLTITEKEQP